MRNDLIEQQILFSLEDCEYLKTLFDDIEFKRSKVNSRGYSSEYSRNRTSEGLILTFDKDTRKVLSNKLNDMGIFGNPYTFSVLRYDVGQEFKKHIDNTYPTNTRFKTVVIQLSNENEYEGGELVINNNGNEVIASKEIGNTIVFHSSLEHWVEKVTSGRRYSIVFWVEKEHLNINNTLI